MHRSIESSLSDIHRLDEILSQASQCNLGRYHYKWNKTTIIHVGVQFDSAERIINMCQFHIIAILSVPEHAISYMNVSDDDGDDTETLCDDNESVDFDEIYKPSVDKLKAVLVRNGDFVEVTHVDDKWTIYIRPTNNDEEYVNLLKLLNDPVSIGSRHEPSMLNLIREGCVVAAKFEGDFSRAVQVDENTMQLIDIGAKIPKNLDEVMFITRQIFAYNRMAIQIQLKLPSSMSSDAVSAVENCLNRLKFNRFEIAGTQQTIEENSIVDLIFVRNGESLTKKCLDLIRSVSKKMYISDLQQKRINGENVQLWIADNSNLAIGFVCCVRKEDTLLFSLRMSEIAEYARDHNEPYVPDHLELCIAMMPDEQGEPLWYRAQYHQTLTNGRAQIGLIDFGNSVIVKSEDIRMFNEKFSYEIISFVGKLRNYDISIDLLNTNLFENYAFIVATKVSCIGNSKEIFLPPQYFVEDENVEEEMLQLED